MGTKRSPTIKSASQDIEDLNIPAEAMEVFKNSAPTHFNISTTPMGKKMLAIVKYGTDRGFSIPDIQKAIFKAYGITISHTTVCTWKRTKINNSND